MTDIQNKFKRQIEVLGICLSENYEGVLKTFDLADIFDVEELTIKRDLQDLRSMGIDIHSEKSKGVRVFKRISDSKLRELIQQYSALSYSENFVEKSTNLLVNKLREKALSNMVTLQMSIERNHTALIDYENESGIAEFRREISPVLIFESDNYWRVLALNEGKLKQFHLNKILEARETERTFKPLEKQRIDDLFKFSWKSWLGDEEYKVRLKLSHVWAERIRTKQLMEFEYITENPDGTLIYETTVNSLDEITSWIVSRGSGVIVIEPDELREKVIKVARDTLKNYENS